MMKDFLESKLVEGTTLKIGKGCSSFTGVKEGTVLTLVAGTFEYDNGLYTEAQTAPSVWNETSKEFDSIYHLFGNSLEYYLDSEILESVWEIFCDTSYYHMWCVRDVRIRDFNSPRSFHFRTEEDARAFKVAVDRSQPILVS